MSKRRVFDIDFEDTDLGAEDAVPAGTDEARRGPMAAAISENAAALSERQLAEAAIRAENDRLAHEYVSLKKNGQIVGLVDVREIKSQKLIRDRRDGRDAELEELKTSIKDVGLSNPILVEEVEVGFELIQGFRRLTAFRELLEETGDPKYARIPATLQAKGAQLEQLYRRMVDENLVRRDISFAEMARLAMSFAKQTNDVIGSSGDPVDVLYASAGRQKRAYIRNFAHLLHVLGDDLNFPEAIPRSMGLALLKLLDMDPKLAGQIRAVLASRPGRDASGELAVLRAAVNGAGKKPKVAKTASPKTSSKTTIKLNRPEGVAKCTAASGRFEVLLDHDFGAVDPRKLEVAARAFLDALKE